MAEFCRECWNEINETKDPAWAFLLSPHLEPCEECGEWKHLILRSTRCTGCGALRQDCSA